MLICQEKTRGRRNSAVVPQGTSWNPDLLVTNKNSTMIPRTILTVLLVLIVSGVARAGMHLIRLMLLAAVGLAGMWMMHTLAQDYTQITSGHKVFTPGLFKRSVPHGNFATPSLNVDYGRILEQDPKGCARRLVCQLSALPEQALDQQEMSILQMIRSGVSAANGDPAGQEFVAAAELGRRTQDQSACWSRFNKCPFTASQIWKLLKT